MDNSPASSSTSGNSNDGHLIELLATQIDSDSIATVINYQKNSLARFEKTNEMLSNCCILSEKRLEKAKKEFAENRELILGVKADLESIFHRIRLFKQILAKKYPTIYNEVESLNKNEE
ncbi:unnamed protein product [Dracunculus medinensis]|uniref:KxDL domain-containing protein n=1 Tax=Dracunculus medinensis TaxID=318479 RepID=A0A0N4U4G3_DRAME|nr:unnamed protein product [Dracunculus medinensis]